jgi:hypothetical protein
VRVVHAHRLADLARNERELLLGQTENIDLDVKQIVGSKLGAEASRNDI